MTYQLAAQLATAERNVDCAHMGSTVPPVSLLRLTLAMLASEGSNVRANSQAWKNITPTTTR